MIEKNPAIIRDIFSLKAEYETGIRDKYGRFMALFSGHTVFTPTVSNYLHHKGFRPKYPDNKNMAVCISHDIDRLFSRKWSMSTFLNQQLKTVVKAKPQKLVSNFQHLKRQIIPEFDLKHSLNLEKKYGINASYFFLDIEKEDSDFNYLFDEIADQIGKIEAAGSEVGLHGGHEIYDNFKRLESSTKKMENHFKICGYRSHYLRFVVPDTWNKLARLGYKYDTTLGFSESVGFRNGMCYPFSPYDLSNKMYMDIYELPLIVMDVTLFENMKLDFETAFTLCSELINRIEQVNGVFTLLWHNDFMFGERGEFYEKIINVLLKKNAWFATGSDLIDLWESNNHFNEIKELLEMP
jgi:peptidoglycan/xylan/chitin deacetylase (PgdA/CDA1 family)